MPFDTNIIIILAALALAYFWYASIISKRNKALEALSGIDVQLKKRSNLIPNILKIAKKFMDHEKALFVEVTRLREKLAEGYDQKDPNKVKEHLATAEDLSSKMSGFMVQVENYPDLKSDQTMIQAQQTYNEVEAQISAARRFYNSAVSALRNAIQIFPGNIIAKIAGVSSMPFYEADEESKKPIDASSILDK
jgi:LemA protein